ASCPRPLTASAMPLATVTISVRRASSARAGAARAAQKARAKLAAAARRMAADVVMVSSSGRWTVVVPHVVRRPNGSEVGLCAFRPRVDSRRSGRRRSSPAEPGENRLHERQSPGGAPEPVILAPVPFQGFDIDRLIFPRVPPRSTRGYGATPPTPLWG